jgi:hypothetical protein
VRRLETKHVIYIWIEEVDAIEGLSVLIKNNSIHQNFSKRQEKGEKGGRQEKKDEEDERKRT